MKVRTSYRDGMFWMTPHTAEMEKVGFAGVFVGDQEWERWQRFVKEYREWQDRLTDLDGEQYMKDHVDKDLK